MSLFPQCPAYYFPATAQRRIYGQRHKRNNQTYNKFFAKRIT
jgi:hypothetical protein